ncbi:MAG: hypothetical protein HOF94_05440 [Alphaproteobacteria bacterium]|jgi:hypothetical protein|nr:hypothetical protein [Alphaproteobacteria bacterium]
MMKTELAKRLVQVIEKTLAEGQNALRERAALVAQAMCCAEVEHDDHDEEVDPTFH